MEKEQIDPEVILRHEMYLLGVEESDFKQVLKKYHKQRAIMEKKKIPEVPYKSDEALKKKVIEEGKKIICEKCKKNFLEVSILTFKDDTGKEKKLCLRHYDQFKGKKEIT